MAAVEAMMAGGGSRLAGWLEVVVVVVVEARGPCCAGGCVGGKRWPSAIQSMPGQCDWRNGCSAPGIAIGRLVHEEVLLRLRR
jgi:hypothetical protein